MLFVLGIHGQGDAGRFWKVLSYERHTDVDVVVGQDVIEGSNDGLRKVCQVITDVSL